MATLRSTLPLRLRHLLTGEGAAGPSLKLESEPPPKVKAFIDKVIKSPLHDIAIPLSGFRWEYNKGNFHHWRPLFLHFDTYFKTYISCRKDLLLSDIISEDDGVFPKHAVLQILRVMQIILENCHNKSSFSGLEHFKLLFASTDPEILIATLETLASLVKINPSKLHVSGKLIGCGSVNSCLLSLAQGWGSKEEGLGLYSCVMANERIQDEGLSLFPSDIENEYDKSHYRLGSTLYFEFHGVDSQNVEGSSSRNIPSNLRVIHIPDMHLQKEDDLLFLKQCIEQYDVPPEHRFSLLTRIRFARAFRSPRTCRLYSRICLLAFIVLVQSNDAHDELVSFFSNEPEYTNELIRIVRSEESIPGSIKTLAMLALSAQLAAYSSSHERARILSGSSIISAGGNRMILLNALQKAVSALNRSSDPSSLSFVEALLQFYLLHVISSSSSGSAIRGSGMVPTLLPLLQDVKSAHMHLVCFAVKTLQKLMDYSNAAVTLFKDLGGVELLAQRLQTEVHRVIGLAGADGNSMAIGDQSRYDDDRLYSQKRLIKALLKALGSATYAPANTSRSQNTHDNSLPASLSLIFGNVEKFGGDIYFSAVTVMSEIIHKDPTCFSSLHEFGLPDAFLSSVVAGILPSSKAITCIPSGLGAICLNAKGLEAVKETMALHFLADIFTSRKYVVAMNEGVVPLANAVEELLRHVSSLRSTGVDIIIEIIHKLASMGDDVGSGLSGKVDSGTAMETDSEDRAQEGHGCLVSAIDVAANGISNERFVQLCIYHVMVLVHRTMENSETCRLFVEKKGIEALMKLLLRPSIAQSSEGMSIALHSTVVFKGFTQHHSAVLARAFCSSLRDRLKKTLDGFNSVTGSFLLDPRITPDKGIFSSLFVVEFLLFLAASKDNRWVTALLAEFGNGSEDVLEDIGRVHRELLWQISLLEDAKLDVGDKGSSSGPSSDPQKSDSNAGDTEEQRFNSFRQFLDPLLRRRMSGWSVESQFFDLISLYRDLGRAAGVQPRLVMDGPSNLRLGSSQHLHGSGSSDASGPVSSMEGDTQRTYYSSCSDMMRSLAFHISYLFLELGKVMLLPSRRRDDTMNVSPAAKSVVSTFSSIILDHLNFGGYTDSSGSETPISSKCRYFGKVIDFIDNILLDRPDSCNPILLNCFYGHEVVQAVLTTFEATSQLLFTVNRAPASPMDTDDGSSVQGEKEETDNSWIYGPLASYGTLMDHLVTSSFIISPFTKHLLGQPLTNGNVPFPRDAEAFVKVLQSKVLKTVLPIWTHPQFTECSYEFITTVISIMRHVYYGVEVKNVNNNSGARMIGPPLNESVISTIVEMGFSRSRAEEALRQVGANSVEMAMEWLFSHPEEAQEDDELARALAMSLGNSGTSQKDEVDGNASNLDQEEEIVQLPPVDDLLMTSTRLLQMKEQLAFPVRDLLVMLCSQNDGQYRSKVISFVIEHVRVCSSILDSGNSCMLSALFHVLALVLHEDTAAQEAAFQNGLIKIASDLLSQWDPSMHDGHKGQVPKWVTTAFLAIDRLLQLDPKLNPDISEQLKIDDVSNQQASVTIDEDKQNNLQSTFGLMSRYIDEHDQKQLIEIACRCIKNQLPSETMHVVLQLCATLTRTHSVAVAFLDAGGLPSLLSLPTTSLFSGFDNVAATIVRHILEDPHTLQQAMESEIRHSLVSATNRHSNGRLTPRNFLLNLASVISRDPVVFMRAAQSVCQIEMVGERPYVILLKDREKDKSKEKEKEKASEKDKHQLADGKTSLGDANSVAPAQGKLSDSNSKSAKVHRKSPQSFISVIELLLDSVITFVPSQRDDGVVDGPSIADMDIDGAANKGKGKAIATVSEESETNNQETSASLAKTVFILKLLTEIMLTYASSVHILLRRDAEVSSCRGPPQRGTSGNYSGGIFHHILQKFLPYSGNHKKEKKVDGDWRQKLATRASQFLVASCVRSTEARRRVFTEISHVLNDFVDSSNGFRPPDGNIHAFIDLLNDVLAARSPTGAYISAEASATFLDVGLVLSLTRILEVLDLDHADSPKVVTGLVKALEAVTKEHAISADPNSGKGENTYKPPEQSQPGRTDTGGDRFQSLETNSQPDRSEAVIDQIEPFTTVQASGSSESIRDDMEHDRDMDGGFAPGAEDDYMNENSEEAGGIENGMDSVAIRFEFSHNVPANIGDEDDDEEMSGDDGDEGDEDEDEEDEEHNDLEEDEVHHMSQEDTDQDDHEIDEDEFDEDVLEEEDEEDEDDEGVILRLEEGINGINVFDHIEVFGRENSFPNDTLHVMPVEVFGSRRQGRTTSIYNLLGRSADHGVPSQHPLLMEPPSVLHPAPPRQSESSADMVFSDRNLDNSSSRLDTIFRSLRNGRHGHRFNMWVDDSQQRGGSSATAIPQGLEELLVSQLRRPTSDKPSDQNTTTAEPQGEGEPSHLEESETGVRTDAPVETIVNNGSISALPSDSTGVDGIENSDGRSTANDFHGREGSSAHTQAVDMQYEHNDVVVRDVEAVSQESSGSGATLGESLRSLEVEIGSADGHDDGGERQASTDRLPLGDLQSTRVRRTNISLGNSNPVSCRDLSLQSVTEVSENPGEGADQSGPDEQQINREAESGSIDPAFLDALPEDLRAEVLSAQQGQAAQPSNDQPQSAGDIDPEFLAALPSDIRAEVLAQQQAQRLQQSQELEGQPVEMDAVSIIATFPSDLREEVLLTSSDAILANLTPALVAEANMLRERFAHRYHSRTLFGMYPRSRRGESSRRGEAVGASLDRAGGGIASRRSMGGKLLEADGAPLVDTEALKAMIRLLRVVQPLYKGQLQRLLLNLCAHHETRTTLVQILMDMLMLDMRGSVNHLSSTAEPSYRLYACQSHVMYSRPQYLDGVPPLVSRRVLETLTYLARNHLFVAKLLLQLELPQPPVNESDSSEQARGKAVMRDEIESKQHQNGDFSIVLLLSLLNQPLYLRSIAHLEQLLNLLDVVIDNAENNSNSSNKSGESPVEHASGSQMQEAELNVTGGSSSVGDVISSKTDECLKSSGSGTSNECDTQALLFSLPRAELKLLCSLLAREGLSDNAYVLVAEVLRKLVAIAPTHCHLFITELADSVQQLSRFAMDELRVFGEAENTLLSTTSTSGTAILRVLQALSSLISSLHEKEKDQQTPSKREQNDPLCQVGEINAALEPLWLELSTCIAKIESYSDSVTDLSASSTTITSTATGVMPPLPAGTQNILPYVESFFVTCEKLHPAQSGAGHDFSIAATSDVEDASSAAQQKTSCSLAKVDEKHVAFVKFSDKHRKLLNAFIRQNPGLLEKSFSLMLKVPRFIDFDNKRAHFRSKIKHQHDHHHSPLRISVRRAYILEDSYNQLRMRSTQDLKGRLTVHFQGEEGIDAGGLTREWYQLLSRVIFDKGALLFTTVGNESTFQPNPNSVYQTEHLSYFKFVGRVVGKAQFDGQLLDVHFTRSFYKHILGVKVTYHDIEAIDPDYFKNLKWMLENDISDVLDLTFSIDADEEKLILYERAEVTDCELIPGGRNIRVTEENKHEYVGLVAEHRLTTAIRPQINAFLEGFSELIPRDLISIFNDKELELLISGLPDIDLDDLRANTEYSGYSAASPVIQWFWEVVQGFSKEDKARLLQFVTGTSKVPLEGFSALQGISGSQRFQIHKAYGSPDHLPSAHTCFNQLDLPEYPSKQHLEGRLLLAIHEANEGFGFG
ncbi:E3 ubiquitin-protein ligase UPL2-like [Telopea speciosissima]|uniref:E3 ubiquitin-protein ligase UPL2-like n=1 Tax=Telopea speciosissima TaxID=54955 RepID=UPI001CC4EBE1|nr:E3 ubiquitin-protein ligase UPL2-like [Telopea speciosissima]